MARIFLSHAGQNNSEAIALRDWMIAQGWEDLFLDLDPERGLKAGERWQAALKAAAERCQMILFLISPAWVASRWCLAEFLLALQMNKRIFGVIVAPTPLEDLPTEMTAEWQLVDLTASPRDYVATVKSPLSDETATVNYSEIGLDRLRTGLLIAGLDPKYFPWPPEEDPERPPYRGLRPLEAEDAGIFFGRDGSIVEALDRLRGLREAAPPRVFVILGASGAGKSSLLRAGLLPRLARDDRHFLPLRVVRPERAVISGEEGFIASLEHAFKEAGKTRSRADIRAAFESGATELRPLLRSLVEITALDQDENGKGRARPPTLIIPIDQAEELFLTETGEESEEFLRLLLDLISTDTPAIAALFTIRSDSYKLLQSSPELGGLRKTLFDLPAMTKGSYGDLIKGPARRLKRTNRLLKIEESLVDALLADIEMGGGKDALPLLAFTLERLYREYGGSGNLRLEDYRMLGGIKGSIEAAVERALIAADANPAVPKDNAARLALLRRGLIPWLAGIDPDSGAPRRRVARLSEIPDNTRPLIHHFVEQRLLATDLASDTGETTIEPAHEALLRQWSLLQGWLEEDAGALRVLEGVKRASRDWSAKAKDAGWLVHESGRLEDAELLRKRPDLTANLESTDLEYLAACRDREDTNKRAEAEQIRRERAQAKKLRRYAYGALTLTFLVIGASFAAFSYYIQATGQCVAASVYTYPTGRFEKRGGTWIEYKEENAQYATFTQRLEDAMFVYIVDTVRKKPIPGRSELEAREFFVRIPKCGGQVDWTWSNPMQWTAFQIVDRPPFKWYDHILAVFDVLGRWIRSM